jgi:hypothetical protein
MKKQNLKNNRISDYIKCQINGRVLKSVKTDLPILQNITKMEIFGKFRLSKIRVRGVRCGVRGKKTRNYKLPGDQQQATSNKQHKLIDCNYNSNNSHYEETTLLYHHVLFRIINNCSGFATWRTTSASRRTADAANP